MATVKCGCGNTFTVSESVEARIVYCPECRSPKGIPGKKSTPTPAPTAEAPPAPPVPPMAPPGVPRAQKLPTRTAYVPTPPARPNVPTPAPPRHVPTPARPGPPATASPIPPMAPPGSPRPQKVPTRTAYVPTPPGSPAPAGAAAGGAPPAPHSAMVPTPRYVAPPGAGAGYEGAMRATIADARAARRRKEEESAVSLRDPRILAAAGGVVILLGWLAIGSFRKTAMASPFDGHLQRFLSLNYQAAPGKPSLAGKVLVLCKSDGPLGDKGREGQIDPVFFELPETLRARRPEEVGTVVWIEWGQKSAGGASGIVLQTAQVTVLNVQASVRFAPILFVGPRPADGAQKPGERPNDQVLNFLFRLPFGGGR